MSKYSVTSKPSGGAALDDVEVPIPEAFHLGPTRQFVKSVLICPGEGHLGVEPDAVQAGSGHFILA